MTSVRLSFMSANTGMNVYLLATVLLATSIRTTFSFVVNHPIALSQNFKYGPMRSRSTSSTPLNILSNRNNEADSFDDFGQDDKHPRKAEFEIDAESDLRKRRMEEEKKNQESFAPYGNDLWDLRTQLDVLSKELVETMASGGDTKAIREQLRMLEQKDANVVYGLELDRMDKAFEEGRIDDAAKHSENAKDARNNLAQFNFEGLWIGKYGDGGFELVNVTYMGDTLIARKVTADKTVPPGEITFQADLSPQRHTNSLLEGRQNLPNIDLSEEASDRWGNRELQRFEGLGQVADEGFKSSQWLEGQLVIINEEYFSFSWLPLSFQVFFGRPSPEVLLKMMQEAAESHAESLDSSVEHLTRCLEATTDAIEDGSLDDSSECCIIFDDAVRCFE